MQIKVLASGSKGNAIWISDGVTELLLDAGLPVAELQRKLDFRLSDVAGVLIGHGHQDHCRAVPELLRLGMKVYATLETAQRWKSDAFWHQIVAGENWGVGTWIFSAFPVQHDCPGAVGYLLFSTQTGEKALYITDSAYSSFTFVDIDVMLVECNHSLELLHEAVAAGDTDRALKSRVMHNHMSLETLLGFLRACGTSKLKAVYLLHLSDRHSDAESFRRSVQEATGVEVYVG